MNASLAENLNKVSACLVYDCQISVALLSLCSGLATL